MNLDRTTLESIPGLNLNNKIIVIENNESEPFEELSEKAFLSCKNIQELALPPSITQIGKWAFAHMKELRVLTIPANSISLAKDAFLDCPKLSEIKIVPDESNNPGLPIFFGTLVGTLKAYSGVEVTDSSFNTLFTPDLAASSSTHSDWMQLYDSVITDFVNRPDIDGFKLELLGWFNVESEESQREKYEHSRRIDKITISFLRLKYDLHLSDCNRYVLFDYLKRAMEFDEIWELLSGELGQDIINIKSLEASGALTADNRVKLVDLLNSNKGNPEVISYLLSNEPVDKTSDLFDSLVL